MLGSTSVLNQASGRFEQDRQYAAGVEMTNQSESRHHDVKLTGRNISWGWRGGGARRIVRDGERIMRLAAGPTLKPRIEE